MYRQRLRVGMTLVELLVATTLGLMLMAAVAVMFGRVAESITDSRSMLESAERLRLAEVRLQMDLAGITAPVNPPLKPEKNKGYFEYIEGPVGVVAGAFPVAVNIDNGNQPDQTVGDFDDILMFTMRTTGKPFVGRCASTGVIQSDFAEVAWFVRGRTLYRRVLLVAPSAPLSVPAGESFYGTNDISVRLQGGVFVANMLGDLTMRENRFAHPADTFPFDVRRWGQLRLPTLRECSQPSWIVGQLPPAAPPNPATTDLWTNDSTQRIAGNYLGSGPRISDDVILTNVIGFDVKAFDPGRNDYVDVGNFATGKLSGVGHEIANGCNLYLSGTYDTWSTHYEHNGINEDNDDVIDEGTDRLDTSVDSTKARAFYHSPVCNGYIVTNPDGSLSYVFGTIDGDGIVDNTTENETSPPYPCPLRGIQVKIRVFEPDSKQVREVTVIQDFLP